jgi:hypothetical protein
VIPKAAPACKSAELRRCVNRPVMAIAKPSIDLYEYVKITPRLRTGLCMRIIGWLG